MGGDLWEVGIIFFILNWW